MTKEELKKYIEYSDSIYKFFDDLSNNFDINLYDTKLYSDIGELLDLFITTNYQPIGADTLNWWIWENDCGKNKLKMFDENGVEMCRDFDEIYDYIKQYERV